jgi:hypothetical protein
MIVTTKEGKSSLLDCSSYSYNDGNKYWSYFFTDRGMYKSDDTINVWGYIKNRYEDEDIDYLSLEISQRNYYYYYSSSNNSTSIIKKTIDVNDSFFEGTVKLPDLPEGYYYISLKKGNKTIINKSIRVENYTKPSYKLEVTKDKKAIFVDDEANFNIKASFFEGTGVSNLDVSYSVSAYNLSGNISNTTKKADLKGNLSVNYSPSVGSGVQGESTATLNARATLPESGEIQASSSLRVFINDINIQPTGKIKDGVGTVSAQVNKIDLDRINNGTGIYSYDYLGDTVSGQKLNGTIYKNTWIRTENGTYYDYINNTTYKTYTYRLNK